MTNKMSEIIILIGEGRAGKTTYASKIEKQGYEFISIDDNYHYGGEEEYFRFVDFVADTLNKNPDKNFILDGYLDIDAHFTYLKSKLRHHKIKPIIIFANCEVIRSRGKGGAVRISTAEEIIESYKGFQTKWGFEEFVEGNKDNRKVETYGEVMKVVENRMLKQDVIDFLEKLKTRNHDPYYQTIELPFDLKIRGYNADFEHKSWNEISQIYDFRGKKVADIGTHNGYFCFEIKEQGASDVVGYDKNEQAVETAKEIAGLKCLDIDFKVLDIERDDIPNFDIILFLNASHHLNNPVAVFDRIFSRAGDVILEVQLTQRLPEWSIVGKEKLIEIAEKHNHKLIKEVKSPRPDRMIFLFGK